MTHVAAAINWASAAGKLGASLRVAFLMFWATFWALALGFALSGAVQAFGSRRGMRRTLGDHRPAAVARATGLGMASSSCSYAATAMARSLFARGADFLTAMVFMFASTNLVVELGIVMWVLLGWQFTAGELVGGPIMIVLLVVAGSLTVAGTIIARARARVGAEEARGQPGAPGHPGPAAADPGLDEVPWRRRLRSPAGWADAAGYTFADLRMLRREIALGFLIAGFVAVLVPAEAWTVVFLHGHGAWTQLENVLVGPLVAVAAFVCSVGNVPLAAALWGGGVSFGGVLAFVFADLITLPLLVIYARFYGRGLAVRLFFLFWGVMSAAALATQMLFSALGLVPAHRPAQIVPESVGWNATTALNIVFALVLAALWWLARNRRRFAPAADLATDPVCGMPVRAADAPVSLPGDDRTRYFCSAGCRDRFLAAGAGAGGTTGQARSRAR